MEPDERRGVHLTRQRNWTCIRPTRAGVKDTQQTSRTCHFVTCTFSATKNTFSYVLVIVSFVLTQAANAQRNFIFSTTKKVLCLARETYLHHRFVTFIACSQSLYFRFSLALISLAERWPLLRSCSQTTTFGLDTEIQRMLMPSMIQRSELLDRSITMLLLHFAPPAQVRPPMLPPAAGAVAVTPPTALEQAFLAIPPDGKRRQS